ncbi:histidine kinase, partial [Flavobacterium sp. WLB]
MRLIISFVLFFVINTAFAQHINALTEEEYLILQDKIRLNFNANVDSALVYANQLARSNNNKHLAFANAAISSLLQMKGDVKQSQEKYKKAFFYLEKMPESRDKTQLKSYIYNYGGLSEWKRGNFSKALEIYQQGIKLSMQINDVKQIFKFKANIALINEGVGNYQLAIRNLKQLNDFIDQNESVFTKEQLLNYKSNVNTGLGSSYES